LEEREAIMFDGTQHMGRVAYDRVCSSIDK